MGDPSGHTRQSEQHREHISGEAHGSIDDSGVEVDIGEQFPLDEILIRKSDLFQLNGKLNQRLLAADLKDLIGDLFLIYLSKKLKKLRFLLF